MTAQVVTYELDDGGLAAFEIEPTEGFGPAAAGDVAGRVRDAVRPAVQAAREVVDQLRSLRPDSVDVKFAVKVTGTMNWVVAKAVTEGNFEVTVSWLRPELDAGDVASRPTPHPAE